MPGQARFELGLAVYEVLGKGKLGSGAIQVLLGALGMEVHIAGQVVREESDANLERHGLCSEDEVFFLVACKHVPAFVGEPDRCSF